MDESILEDLYKYIGVVIVLLFLVSCSSNILDLKMDFDETCYIKIGKIIYVDTLGTDQYYLLETSEYSMLYRSVKDSQLVLLVVKPNEMKFYENQFTMSK